MGVGDWGLGIGDWGLGIGDWGLGEDKNHIPHYNLLSINIGECESMIREIYSIPSYDPLYIFKFDILNDENPITNQVEYAVYDKNGKTLNFSYCSSGLITIEYPLVHTENINMTYAEEMVIRE